ncbi:aminodeoxychorismate/anthranilate synthase component II [Pedobacter sp. MR2016-19]|uniref:anthranilate synthase component II n=1 Tax=Pedobacter sp. MR2016-19 TaxID=2780089 RepID=UPI0018771F17|nr:aminodeoxychorismate/anthranilate synthase component II [Pedobacter sp. MR2016-19]MBE5322348.1 aminodeoxychorismate/anthranilate synthase component II [Pedobacter sp. MR2016-19]
MEKNINNTPPSGGKGVVLVIDNYDSFTYNLVHLINEVGYEAEVWRNDKFELADVEKYDKILLSPGPGIPEEAGLLLDVIKTYAPTKSIFGVCLGQQAIAEVFGGTLLNLGRPMHGIATPITVVDGDEPLFWECPQTINVGRYHSWVVSKDNFPSCLKITARDHKNEIMALRHETFDVRGVQFHPESVLTEHGKQMMENWLTTP